MVFASRNMLFALAMLASSISGSMAQAPLDSTCLATGINGSKGCEPFIDGFCDYAASGKFRRRDNVARCYNNGAAKCDLTVWARDLAIGGPIGRKALVDI
ncbi:hypothetical protein CC1G_10308 [Coprinopsis cinerea okayama7|uniref:Glycan binding protein Y3-like domain-containing protein n=1 Tax=Coprinopsis cinerea (strain Okayama-7 / 130 / ATCC MYA-4618 / FGSC 9003) TaxID=240176 RepID=A8P0H1_COPC7|nr:hypothetical protein CC1G_10308 [Coprinopsis cinerea okayama7\|eukprot:XP_001837887.1 hypothetical protein CC1G_10308 [Coprinopsis cinerea okayama7\